MSVAERPQERNLPIESTALIVTDRAININGADYTLSPREDLITEAIKTFWNDDIALPEQIPQSLVIDLESDPAKQTSDDPKSPSSQICDPQDSSIKIALPPEIKTPGVTSVEAAKNTEEEITRYIALGLNQYVSYPFYIGQRRGEISSRISKNAVIAATAAFIFQQAEHTDPTPLNNPLFGIGLVGFSLAAAPVIYELGKSLLWDDTLKDIVASDKQQLRRARRNALKMVQDTGDTKQAVFNDPLVNLIPHSKPHTLLFDI